MYTKLSFENYKIFKNKQELEIKPITIMFGKNNAGKSAVLKLPLILYGALDGQSEEVVPSDVKDETLYTDIRDLVYGRANRAVKLGAIDEENGYDLKFSFFVDNEKEVKSQIEEWDFQRTVYVTSYDGRDEKFTFKGAMPQHLSEAERQNVMQLCPEVDYIGSVRYGAARDMRQKALMEDSGYGGINGYSHLLKDSQTAAHSLLDKVSQWYSDTFMGWGIEVDGSANPIFHINVTNGQDQTNIVDAGFGISQSLPIVIRACRPCPIETMIILEEPEAHLHPAAQGNLGELIARSAKEDANKRYLIETHSFNFILRIRSLVAAGVLNKEDVALYYVDYNENEKCSRLQKIGVDDKGKVSNWPKGVFEETYDEIVRLLNSRIERGQ